MPIIDPKHPWRQPNKKAEALANTKRRTHLSPSRQKQYVEQTLKDVEYILKKNGARFTDTEY